MTSSDLGHVWCEPHGRLGWTINGCSEENGSLGQSRDGLDPLGPRLPWLGAQDPDIDDNNDHCISRGARKLLNEIHGDRIPRTLGNRKLLEVAIRPMPGCFGMFARNAGLAEFNDERPEIGPIVFVSNQI